jgi:hypothetical protein
MHDAVRNALAGLALRTTVDIERAPGVAEKRLVLLHGFAAAHRLDPGIPDDPDMALLDTLLRQPERLLVNLQEHWTNHLP